MIRKSRFLLGALLLVFVLAFFLPGRTLGGQSSSARFVSVPVTVTNKDGDHVTSLSASDFFLSEGRHRMRLESVQEVGPVLVGTNKVKVPFVIFDALGSPGQNETRRECLQLLADSAAKDLPISLSEMDSDGLHEIHGVGTSNFVLASALLQLDDESRFLDHRDQLRTIPRTSEDKSLVAAEIERLRRFRSGSVQRSNMMGTIQAQLNALRQMAVALQRAKGRKTAIWLTGYFPIDVNEAEDSLNINGFGGTSGFPVQNASIEYQKTIDLLNDAQISVFPAEMKSSQASAHLPGPVAGDTTQVGLRRVARSTGGEELAFADGLRDLVQHAEDKSTGYYLLRFQPESSSRLRWNPLKVQVTDKSLKVKSPDGLFSFAASK